MNPTPKEVVLVASGDLRLTANQACEDAQAAMEAQVAAAVAHEGWTLKRGHPYDAVKKHGFIDSQKYGMEVFLGIDPHAPVIVAEAVWQYSHHVLAGLITHQGPILTVANWSGEWPGLVGLLNLNGSLTKAGVKYSTLWSEDFTDSFFVNGLRAWLRDGLVRHNKSHVCAYDEAEAPAESVTVGHEFAAALLHRKAILGIFDEGCMGMYNAIVPDELLHAVGVYKERLSQSTLYAKMQTVSDSDAQSVYQWLLNHGMTFHFGPSEETDLTEAQVLGQCKMYVAAVRLADEFGCAGIGIQYQQGLKDLAPASDLAEGLLNNVERPPVTHETTGDVLYAGRALPCFNEVDECAGLDALVTNRLWRKLGWPPETTLHDIRWGRQYTGEGRDLYVWVFEISGAAPPAHFVNGYQDASSERQPPLYFRLGGGTLKGISRPGWVVWSRIFVAGGSLKVDLGLAESVALPQSETEDRWAQTTSQWPIMHAVLQGISRDQMMARHKANHIQVVYAPTKGDAQRGLYAKAAAFHALGLEVSLCGDI